MCGVAGRCSSPLCSSQSARANRTRPSRSCAGSAARTTHPECALLLVVLCATNTIYARNKQPIVSCGVNRHCRNCAPLPSCSQLEYRQSLQNMMTVDIAPEQENNVVRARTSPGSTLSRCRPADIASKPPGRGSPLNFPSPYQCTNTRTQCSISEPSEVPFIVAIACMARATTISNAIRSPKRRSRILVVE